MQACWRMLQAMATVKAKRAENARKRRVFDRLFGKAMDRRLRRIIDAWQDWAWSEAACRGFQEEIAEGCSGRSWTLGLNMRKQLHPAGKAW